VRLSRPFSFIRTLTVGFGIAPNLLALPVGRKALAGLGYVAFTAGGEFHPALRTFARPVWAAFWNYGQWRPRQQGLQHGESACRHAAKARPEAAK
jgi:hypothetical protein